MKAYNKRRYHDCLDKEDNSVTKTTDENARTASAVMSPPFSSAQ